ncbi:MAG: peptide deformylase [Clostridia bacterium]|nr:peptide deformylase [Clostridia bacterium]
MAIRNIRTEEDEVLRKISREVDIINDKILTLLKDMADTMYDAQGIGLAAPQVGILKRIVVIDAGDGLIELINPKIVEESGEQIETEGCLSIPEVFGEVKRPAKVTVKALNRKGEEFTVEGTELLARALCHEVDHLNGILFKDKVIRYIDKDELKAGK